MLKIEQGIARKIEKQIAQERVALKRAIRKNWPDFPEELNTASTETLQLIEILVFNYTQLKNYALRKDQSQCLKTKNN